MKSLKFLSVAAALAAGVSHAANRVVELSDTERVAIYDEPGQTQFIVPQNISGTAQVLVVGGGGAGGSVTGGGGGGGQVVYVEAMSLTAGDILSVIVADGGEPDPTYSGANGGDSSFNGVVAVGGGGGAGGHLPTAGKDGANGGAAGGNADTSIAGGQPTVEGGHAGATRAANWWGPGGGGGAGEDGRMTTDPERPGQGGMGLVYAITGSDVMYGYGGGGTQGRLSGAQNEWGKGDGGEGNEATPGQEGTGGGGGGGRWSGGGPGGAGGSGTVIIRYTVSNSGQGAVVRVDKSTVLALSPVVFTAEVYGEGHESASLEWDFGDGSAKVTTTGLSVGHAYQAPGSYSVTLVVTFPSGEKVTSSNSDMVTVIQSVYYVDSANENPTAPYDTHANAAKDIKVALAYANNGSTIYVAPGDYTVPGDSGFILLDKPIKLLGEGADPTEVVIRQLVGSSRSWFNDQVMQINHPDALVANVTIQDGNASNSGCGGNIWIKTQGGTVSNCVVRNGYFSSPIQATCGGIHMDGGLVTHTVISNCNYRLINGFGNGNPIGRAVNIAGAGRIENCLIAHNSEWGYGAVVSLYNVNAVMKNCTIVDGTASYWFNHDVKDESGNIITNALGGVHCAKGQVVNCAILDIKGPAYNDVPAKEANPWSGNAENFVNCATDGDAAINLTCVLAGKGDFADYDNGNLVPSFSGALFDAGDDAFVNENTDLAGKRRIVGAHVDIGCYEAKKPVGLRMLLR